MNKRLFVGVFIDYSFFNNKLIQLRQDFDKVSIGKWVEDYNLHFTLKFIGDFPMEQIPELKSALSEHLTEYQEKLVFSGVSVLPNRKMPRVLYIDIQTETNLLLEKFIIIDDICSDFGVKKENREFKPHLTLLRMKSVSNSFYRYLDKYSQEYFGTLTSFRIQLIDSVLTKSGPKYNII
ncbi:MAG: RNA 2',3'-cyclic phosphodiesterase [Bacteroidota bacterium]